MPRLLAAGHHVRGLDSLVVGSRESLDGLGVEVVQADLRDRDAVARAVAGADAVVHLAAGGNVAESLADPFANLDVNVGGTLVLLDACARADVEQLVFASTGGAVAGNAPPPVDESVVPWPVSPYGASKVAGEAYCHAYASSFGLPCVSLRFSNAYGPFSGHKRGAVTSFVRSALAGEPLVVYGDGSVTRDFLYVADLCDGIDAVLARPFADEVFHLASGVETSIRDLASLVLELTGASGSVEHRPARRGEVQRNFARFDRAAAELGYAPRHSLREGLEKTIAWFAAQTARPPAGLAAGR